MRRYCVFSLRGRKEHRSPWFSTMARAELAQRIIRGKGFESIIWID